MKSKKKCLEVFVIYHNNVFKETANFLLTVSIGYDDSHNPKVYHALQNYNIYPKLPNFCRKNLRIW